MASSWNSTLATFPLGVVVETDHPSSESHRSADTPGTHAKSVKFLPPFCDTLENPGRNPPLRYDLPCHRQIDPHLPPTVREPQLAFLFIQSLGALPSRRLTNLQIRYLSPSTKGAPSPRADAL
ncbi:hypothetical protein DFH06DRAFT_1348114 [Mycena polygramma]|nr:hypothetical protein DFH06DRAFT_1348114 [Mycena polygramma]